MEASVGVTKPKQIPDRMIKVIRIAKKDSFAEWIISENVDLLSAFG